MALPRPPNGLLVSPGHLGRAAFTVPLPATNEDMTQSIGHREPAPAAGHSYDQVQQYTVAAGPWAPKDQLW